MSPNLSSCSEYHLNFEVVKDRITDAECGPRAFIQSALAQQFPRKEPFQRWKKFNDDSFLQHVATTKSYQISSVTVPYHSLDVGLFLAKEKQQIADARKIAHQWLSQHARCSACL